MLLKSDYDIFKFLDENDGATIPQIIKRFPERKKDIKSRIHPIYIRQGYVYIAGIQEEIGRIYKLTGEGYRAIEEYEGNMKQLKQANSIWNVKNLAPYAAIISMIVALTTCLLNPDFQNNVKWLLGL